MAQTRISFAYDEEDKEFLLEEAKKDNRKLSSLIQLIIKQWIEDRKMDNEQSKKLKMKLKK